MKGGQIHPIHPAGADVNQKEKERGRWLSAPSFEEGRPLTGARWRAERVALFEVGRHPQGREVPFRCHGASLGCV